MAYLAAAFVAAGQAVRFLAATESGEPIVTARVYLREPFGSADLAAFLESAEALAAEAEPGSGPLEITPAAAEALAAFGHSATL